MPGGREFPCFLSLGGRCQADRQHQVINSPSGQKDFFFAMELPYASPVDFCSELRTSKDYSVVAMHVVKVKCSMISEQNLRIDCSINLFQHQVDEQRAIWV